MVAGIMMAATAFARKEESLDELIKRAETASPSEQVSLYTEIAERQLQNAAQLYDKGNVTEAEAAIADVVTYSGKAHDVALQSRSKQKNTEIALRKMAAKLRDLQRSLALDDQKPVQDAAEHLEKLRTDLLSRMFGKGAK